MGKKHHVPYTLRTNKRVHHPFKLIHYDIWGLVLLIQHYILNILLSMDDFSYVTWLYLIKIIQKNCQFLKLSIMKSRISLMCRLILCGLIIRKNFANSPFTHFMSSTDITYQTSCPQSPQQSSTAKCENRYLLEVTLILLFDMHIPKHFCFSVVAI